MQYIIDVDDAMDLELRSVYPDPQTIFKQAVVDAVHAARVKDAEAQKPTPQPVDESKIVTATK